MAIEGGGRTGEQPLEGLSYGLLQVAGADMAMVLVRAAVLAVAGVGIGFAWPLLGVAAMSSTDDSAEGGKAAAAITTT